MALNKHGWDPDELLKIHITKGELMDLFLEAKKKVSVRVFWKGSNGEVEKAIKVPALGREESFGDIGNYRINSEIYLGFLHMRMGLLEKRVLIE